MAASTQDGVVIPEKPHQPLTYSVLLVRRLLFCEVFNQIGSISGHFFIMMRQEMLSSAMSALWLPRTEE